MAILMPNISTQIDVETLPIPTHQDGTLYKYEMIADGGWVRVYDDTIDGLLDYLIPGYMAMDEQTQTTARIRHAIETQIRLQAQINQFFSNSARTPGENTLLNGPRHTQPTIEQWDCEVPLVLIDAYYEPYQPQPQPISGLADVALPPNIWWLKPADTPLEYLKSLHSSSTIDLHISRDEAI